MTMKSLLLSSILVILLCFNGLAQERFSLRSTAWYVDEVWQSGDAATKQKYKYGDNVVTVNDSNRYLMNNFLGVTRQEGTVIESEHVIVLSNARQTGYFWVFEVVRQTREEVVLKYIPYSGNSPIMEVRLLPYKGVAAAASRTVPEGTANFNGTWTLPADGFSLQLILAQDGMIISGSHCSGDNCKGNYRLTGSVKGDTATVTLHSPKGQYVGKATIRRLDDNSLEWNLIEGSPNEVETVHGAGLKKNNK